MTQASEQRLGEYPRLTSMTRLVNTAKHNASDAMQTSTAFPDELRPMPLRHPTSLLSDAPPTISELGRLI